MLAVFVSLAVLQNIDNFVLAGAYRLKNVIIPPSGNLLIALLSGIATGVPVIVATGLSSEAVQMRLDTTFGIAGRGILLMLGIWTLVGYFRSGLFLQLREEDTDEKEDHRCGVKLPGQEAMIRTSEAIIAGTALAVDNLAPSFAFGLINPMRQSALLSSVLLGILVAGFSIVAVVCGQICGRQGRVQLRRFLPTFITPELISALLLIGIAVAPMDIDDWAADFLRLCMGHLGL